MKFFILLLFLLGCSGNTSTRRTIASTFDLKSYAGIPGLAAGIYINDEFMEIRTEGVRKSSDETLLETEDKFHLGSCTKAMTATLAGIFVEKGLLTWTTPMSELLPDIDMHPSFQNMTFETLLVHRSGLPAEHEVFHELRSLSPEAGRKLIADRLLKASPLLTPGSKYTYSNYGYIIAGHILERISNDSWESLMNRYLFKPLQMDSCGFGVTSVLNEVTPSSPWGHQTVNGVPVPRHFDNPTAMGPASTVHCSIPDWGKFLALHLDGYNGKNNLLTAATYKKLHSVHPSKDSSYTYGGWILLERSWAQGPALTHDGSNTLNYAKAWIAPKKNSFIVSTANIGGDDASRATDAFIREMISKWLY